MSGRPDASRSMHGQLVRAAMLTTFIALLASAAAMLLFELSTYRHAWLADLRTQADLIANSTEASLVFNDPREAERTLQVLRLQSRIRAAAVYDAKGRPFAWYGASPDEAQPEPSLVPMTRPSAEFEGSTLEMVFPIQHENERVGTLYLRATHDIAPRLRAYAMLLALITGGALALSYPLFGRLLTQVTSPLARMTEVAGQVMATRNWRLRSPETEYEDLAPLVRAFNGLLAESQARTSELEAEMAERERAEQGLRQADRRKDEFLATLAHELRNPLAPMSNALALLRSDRLDPGAREHARDILDRQLRHMVRLIDDLLDVSRVTTGKLSLHRQSLDLAALLRHAVELAQPLADQRRLALSMDDDLVAARVTWPVEGDPARLSQVFSNLLNNACRYTEPGGRIRVGASLRPAQAGVPAQVEVSIADTGIGIDPSMQQRVFELFEQADKSLGRGSAGLGIGLTLARQLVQLHGGDIAVHSEGVGHGSTFVVRLPLASAPSTAALAPAVPPTDADARVPLPTPRPATPGSDGPRPPVAAPTATAAAAGPDGDGLDLVLADDNLDFTASLAALLESLGHRVRRLPDGTSALRSITESPPDIALLDIGMPGLDGYALAQRLRAQPETRMVRLVAVTGWGQASDREAAYRAGFDRHLVKPLDPAELIDLLEDLRQPAA